MGTKLVYMAMPLDFTTESGDRPFVDFVENDLKASKHVVYRPDQSFTFQKGTEPSEVVQAVNNAAINGASGMVAFLPKGTQTIGVPMEIQSAISAGKPVVVVTDHSDSWVVAGWTKTNGVKVVEFNASQIRGGVGWLNETMSHRDGWTFKQPVENPVVFEAMSEDAELPIRAYATDAGFDLYVSRNTFIPAGGFADVPCGVAMQINAGEWALITGRSSSIRKKKLHVINGVIDAGYSGELFAGVQNLSSHTVTITKGERVAQVILMGAAANGRAVRFGKVAQAPRGNNGFGSSGR
jgi:deoxyuridine 5'-triphosphate nucleotidohydrolase